MPDWSHILLDPAATGRGGERAWEAWRQTLLRRLAPADVVLAEGYEEAEQRTREAALKGYQKFIAVGGAALAQGMTAGLMPLAESHRRQLKAGVLNLGLPSSWSRTLAIPRPIDRQLEVLAAGHALPLDVGRAESVDARGKVCVRTFLDGALLGLGCRARGPWLRAQPQDPRDWPINLLKSLDALLLRPLPRVRVETEDGLLLQGPCPQLVVMGGRFYPSLGEIAPQASPTDGQFEVGWWVDAGWRSRLACALGLLPGGGLLQGTPLARGQGDAASWRAPGHWQQARTVRINGTTASVPLELDGQPAGQLPATLTLVPRALPFIVESVMDKVRERQKKLLKSQRGVLAGGAFRDGPPGLWRDAQRSAPRRVG